MRFSLTVSSMLVGIISRLAGTHIKISAEKIPTQSVLFVANHFTRFETFLLPYILYHKYGIASRSLADDTVFVGILGRFLRWVGTISNKNKARDCIIVEDLLKGSANWIIYPEGYMVKNKRITFHDGEFCMHSPEYEGPVHTGAAVIALRTRLAQLRAKILGHAEGKRFCTSMGLDLEHFDPNLKVCIVPVSITYYPIRSGKNRFLVWLDSVLHQRNTRIFEEMEIEFNLLLGSQIDIHFGQPIDVDPYMHDFRTKGNVLENNTEADRLINTQRKILTNTMMKAVYTNIQINFDHIFILSLVTMPTLKVCPSYLRTLIYKNARSLRKMQGYRLHSEISREMFRLIINEKYAPFISAIDLAVKQHILYRDSDGEYLFDKSLLEKEYPFHQVRVKNTLNVILREIKWQTEIVKMAEKNSQYSEQELKEDNFNHLKEKEWTDYTMEYMHYFNHPPQKDEKGAPVILYDHRYERGIVFSHGYLAAPREIETLAQYLFAHGINVYVPRLRGHGTDPEALRHVTMHDWETDFERAVTAMKQLCSRVFIGGFSTGGLLALIYASKYEAQGVIVINSALKLHDLRVSYVVPTLSLFNEMIAYLHAKGIMEWIDNTATEQPEINYLRHPLASVSQLEKVMRKASKILYNIKYPVLVIQGDEDPVVKRKSARLIYDTITSKEKKLLILPRKDHAVLADERHQEIFDAILGFIEEYSEEK